MGKTVWLFGLLGFHENRALRFESPREVQVVVEKGLSKISLLDQHLDLGKYPQLPLDRVTRLRVVVASPIVTRGHVRDWCFDIGFGDKFKTEKLNKGVIRLDLSEVMNLIIDLVPGPL